MTLTIGRFTTPNGFNFNESGDRLSIEGWLIPTTDKVNTMKASRIQLLGLSDGDVIPLTASDHAELDGYYELSGVIEVSPLDTMLSTGIFQFSLNLKRVANGYASPSLEVLLVDSYRATSLFDPGVSNLTVVIPGEKLWAPGTINFVRTADSGAVHGHIGYTSTFHYGLQSLYHYTGSSEVEFLLGSTWWPLMGRQVPTVAIDSIRIGNGLLRMTWRSTGIMEVDAYNGSSWGSAGSVGSFYLTGTADSVTSRRLIPSAAPTVLRNDVELVALRWPTYETGRTQHVDVSIRRGEVSFTIASAWAASTPYPTNAWTLGASSAVACTAITASLRQTSNGAGGHRWLLMSPYAHTNNTASGRIHNTAVVGPLTWGIGVEVSGSSAVAPHQAADVEKQWWHALGLRQRVISP